MDRRTFVAAAGAGFLTLATGQAAQAQKLSLAAVSNYLNTLQSVKGDFTQINEDGTIDTGQIMIKRPGKMRFEYNPPAQQRVIVGGGTVAVFDLKLRTPPEQYPLAQTPLKIILDRRVDLTRSGMVTGHREEGPSTIVRAQDPERPELGNIELVFTANPIELRQWVVTNDQGTRTTVILGALDDDAALSNRLFNVAAEAEKLRR